MPVQQRDDRAGDGIATCSRSFKGARDHLMYCSVWPLNHRRIVARLDRPLALRLSPLPYLRAMALSSSQFNNQTFSQAAVRGL